MRILWILAALGAAACGSTASTSAEDGGTQSSTPIEHEAGAHDAGNGCPATWQEARMRCNDPCTTAMVGVGCSYPGDGDQNSDGTWATANVYCGSLQVDGGAPLWICTQ
jgi:hypothetical protein